MPGSTDPYQPFPYLSGNQIIPPSRSSGLSDERRELLKRTQQPLVIIVDDQLTGRRILEELVRTIDSHLCIEAYGDPYQALERIRRQVPDLVLTDYKMPIMNGITFTRHVRSIPGCLDVPLIMVTIVDDKRIRYEALDAGATDFLTRPIDQYECRARCRNLLTLRRQQKIIRSRAKWLEDQVSVATQQIRTRERETLLRLAKAGEYRDEGTGNHVLRMAKYSRLIAEELGLKEAECDEIELAAPMHDIGKIGIPDAILLKAGELTDDESEIMRSHTVIGHEILKDSPSRYIQLGAIIALSHHERYDGSGYPRGLKDDEIPLAARIVAVADIYDALTSERPYKLAWTNEEAVRFLAKQAGTQLDPQCVTAFLRRIHEARAIHDQLKDGLSA